jgi:hypothetical protein
MGTRGATGFLADGKWYVTYNHFDSYPEYLGMRVLEFCKQVKDWEALRENVKSLTLVNEHEKPTDEQMQEYANYYSNPNVDDHPVKDWYWLFHSLQGEGILYAVEKGDVKHMIDDHTFLANSLFCEWAYIIDLDKMKLRVYKGFQKKPPNEKTVLPEDINREKATIEEIDYAYYPVLLLYAYSLYELPEFMLGVTNKFKEQYRAERRL